MTFSVSSRDLSPDPAEALTGDYFPSSQIRRHCTGSAVKRDRTAVPACPEQLGHFVLLRTLGEGGMGTVYQAKDLNDGKLVAVKVHSQNSTTRDSSPDQFHREIKILKEVGSPYVANIIESGEESGILYLVMEFVPGPDLGQLLRLERVFSESIAMRLIADVCRALAPAHQRGIVHCDVKPANALLASEIWNWKARIHVSPRVKLIDFGLARPPGTARSMGSDERHSHLGTPYYMAPEQLTGNTLLTPAVDVYSLGVTLFQFLTGRRPFDAENPVQLATLHCLSPAPALEEMLPDSNRRLARIIATALAKKPEDRYPDSSAMLLDIEKVLSGGEVIL